MDYYTSDSSGCFLPSLSNHSMHASSIYRMAQAGKIPAYKVGRQWRFKKEVIDKRIVTERNQKVSKK